MSKVRVGLDGIHSFDSIRFNVITVQLIAWKVHTFYSVDIEQSISRRVTTCPKKRTALLSRMYIIIDYLFCPNIQLKIKR
jgi:hypothetical protein